MQVPDLDLSVALCAALLSSNTAGDVELHPYVSARLLRFCDSLNKMTGEISLDASEDRVGSRDDWRVGTSE